MVLGIAGIVLGLGLILGIAAVITGHMASKREPHAKGFWTTGLITGYVGIALGILLGLILIASVLLPLIALSTYGY